MAITVVTRNYNAETKQSEEIERTFAHGCVLKTYMGTVQVFFDEWAQALHATYWDEETQQIRTVSDVKATADATDEVKAKVRAYLKKLSDEKALEEAQEEVLRKVKGSQVKVVKGRQGKGTVGKVVVEIVRPYQTGYRSSMLTKFGIATSDEKVKVPAANGKVYENYKDMVWAWAHNCELVEVPAIDMEAVRERAEGIYESRVNYDWKGVL